MKTTTTDTDRTNLSWARTRVAEAAESIKTVALLLRRDDLDQQMATKLDRLSSQLAIRSKELGAAWQKAFDEFTMSC